MSRAANLLLVLLFWAAIYLPGLGSLEIKGEEGRRILPATSMLDTGDFLVPHVGSEPYYRKPPLVNWLVACSFKITGARNEWTARIPSALSVLAVALAFILVARTSLGARGSVMAALIWMANFGMIEKGRLIEIEGLYVSLLGLAQISWLSGWHQRRSQWLTWTVPFVFLGLGILAKGPLHLVFFYSIVVAVLFRSGELRNLLHPAHLAGILIALGIFATWAVPYWLAMQGTNLAQIWSAQFTGRLGGTDFKPGHWLLNIPRGLAYFLPWTLLLPLVPGARFSADRDTNLAKGLLWGCLVPFVIVNLLPGSLPRYSMPVLPGAAWLMAMTLASPEIHAPRWWNARWTRQPERRWRFVTSMALVSAIVMVLYAIAVVPFLQKRSKIRPIAAQIDALMPESESLYAIDPDYQPFLFYIRKHLIYVDRIEELPSNARYLLFQPGLERQVLESERWAPRHARQILSVTDYRNRTVILAKIDEANP